MMKKLTGASANGSFPISHGNGGGAAYLPDARQRLFEAAHEDVVGKTLLCEVSLKTTSFFCGLQFHIK
jgi:hypothetical protein